MTDILYWLAITAAAAMVGFSKSGLAFSVGVLGVPILAAVMTARDAAGVLLPVMLAMDVIALFIYGRKFDRRILWIMLPGCLLGTVLGWLLSASVSEPVVRLAIGIVTFVFVIDAWFPIRKKLALASKPSAGWGAFWGAAAGFTSFISHTGGPPFQVYVLRFGLTPQILAGTTTVFFAINNAAKLVPYYFLGQLEMTNLMLSALMTPIAIVALIVGVLLLRTLPQKLFYNITYVLLFVFSLQLMWDGGKGILAP